MNSVQSDHDDNQQSVSDIRDDLGHYLKRVTKPGFAEVHKAMKESNVVESLDALTGMIAENRTSSAATEAEAWAAKLGEWAKMLSRDESGGGSGEGNGQPQEMSPEQMELLMKLMQIRQQEEGLREHTRYLEKHKDKDPSGRGQRHPALGRAGAGRDPGDDGELKAELARQQQDLEFYRGLVSERFGSGSLKIQELSVSPGGAPRAYVVKVTLVQTTLRDQLANGTLSLALDDARRGALVRLPTRDFAVGGRSQVTFNLRYFQTLEIPIELPEGFEPASLRVEFRSNRGGPEPEGQTFPWASVLETPPAGFLTPGPPAG